MQAPLRKIGIRRRCAMAAMTALICCCASLAAPAVLAQDAPPPPAQATRPAPATRPGLLDAIGRWFQEGADNFRTHLRGAKARMDDLSDKAAADRRDFDKKALEAGASAVEVTKGAVEAVAKLPTARVMDGHERCAVAPNGAPDCLAAAEALCRKHGFASGKSMDFTSAEECPPAALLAGRRSGPECTTVTFISRAMCQ
jgi:hypothetical protein